MSTAVLDDEWADVKIGNVDVSVSRAIRGDEYGHRCVTRSDGATDYRGDGSAASSWHCSRERHDESKAHIAMSGHRVVGVWGMPVAEETGDPDPDPEPFELTVGTLYKFRSRPTVLMLIGIRSGGQVEVLDLTHERYRVLRREQLIPRKADAEPISVEQIQWVAKFMAERREQVRKNAVKQRQDGFFKSSAELNRILGELEMEEHTPSYAGAVQITFQVSGKVHEQAAVREAFLTWANGLTLPVGFTRAERVQNHNIASALREV